MSLIWFFKWVCFEYDLDTERLKSLLSAVSIIFRVIGDADRLPLIRQCIGMTFSFFFTPCQKPYDPSNHLKTLRNVSLFNNVLVSTHQKVSALLHRTI